MYLTHYRIFDERTGDPTVDNPTRRINRLLSRDTRKSFRVTVGKKGRRRKKQLSKETMHELIKLRLAFLHEQLQEKR